MFGPLLCRSISDPSVDRTRDGPNKFNRYDTFDRAPVQPPPPHDSGRQYKYRQRYAIKTRSRMIEHEPPDVLKQFSWKPWTKPPESPQERPIPPKPKAKFTKRLQRLDDMEKRGLVDELQWQHPTRVLNVGTINANVSRALIKEGLPVDYLPRIKTCLSDIAQQAAKAKRTCQLAIGQYLEHLLLENVDTQDRLILGQLCHPFTDKDVIIGEGGDGMQDSIKPEEMEDLESNDECDSSSDKKKEALQFFITLLSAIYKSETPPLHYMDLRIDPKKTSVSVLAVRAFFDKAKKFLPRETGQR